MSKNRDLATLLDTVLEKGDYGIGSDPSFQSEDLNALVFPTRRAFGSGSLNRPPGVISGDVEVRLYGAISPTRIFQEVTGTGAAEKYGRYGTYDGTTAIFDSWFKIYTQGTIVGTVSESAGVPTGAVIERGSNANGEYVKFADGTLICWAGSSGTGLSLPTAYAGGFRSGGSAARITYPASFIDESTLKITQLSVPVAIKGGVVTTTYFDPLLWSPTSGSYDYSVDIIAIGRWY